VLGLAIAAPVGPIGLLCIRRTLAEGRLAGLLTGLGAASADAVYGSLAAFGLAFLTDLLVGGQNWLRLAGGLFLCYLGVRTFFAPPAGQEGSNPGGGGLWGAYASTFFLTLTNPLTILSFSAVFAGLGVIQAGSDYLEAGWLVVGVFSGSAAWWLLLSSGVALLRRKVTLPVLGWVNRLSGAAITGFGLAALASLLGRFLPPG
jgi:threonine/homoserine/homoserine lactone efflux protein